MLIISHPLEAYVMNFQQILATFLSEKAGLGKHSYLNYALVKNRIMKCNNLYWYCISVKP